MSRNLVLVLIVLCLPVALAFVGGEPAAAAPAAGGGTAEGPAAIFVAQKCNLCHSLASHDVERKTKSEKVAGPDLSAVGTRHDAAWITRWLKREETLKGKPHQKKFTGSDEDLTALARWLATLEDTAAVPAS